MIELAATYPFLVGVCCLPVTCIAIFAYHYRRPLSQWFKVTAAGFPVIGFVARTARQPGATLVLNPEDTIEVCVGERNLVTQFIDMLTPRLSPEQWQHAEIFLVKSGDSGLPALLRAPPIRQLGEVTIVFLESYLVSLLLTPTLSIWVTPEQLPLVAFGSGVVLSIVLSAVLVLGGVNARLYEAYQSYMSEHANNPRVGNPQPKPIGWRDDQSVDDLAPRYQMGLSRLQARGKPLWIVIAILSAVAAVVGATGIRSAELDEQTDLEAQYSSQLQQMSEAETLPVQPVPQNSQRVANAFSLSLVVLAFLLAAALCYTGAKQRTALGRDVRGLLELTRGAASFAEEAALLRRNYQAVGLLLARMQGNMHVSRRTTPTVRDILHYEQHSPAKAWENDAPIPPSSQANSVNVAQLPARHGPLEKTA